MRDQQRQKVYDAERAAEGRLRELHRSQSTSGSRPMDVGLSRVPDSDCQEFVNEVCASVGVERVAVRLVTVEAHAAKYAHAAEDGCFAAEIVLPPWARNKVTILHELAHHITHRFFPGHGAEFVENFLMLLRMFLPGPVAQLFMDEFLAAGVEVKSSDKQGGRFLAYALKLKKRGEPKKVVVVTNEPRRYVGWVIDFKRGGDLLLGRCANHGKPQHIVPAEEIRYGTWWLNAS